MAIAHDAQTRFPTTDGGAGVDSSDTTTGNRSFTHNPVGVPKGVVVVVNCAGTAQPCTGVTYDGVAMSLTQSATDTTEAGSVWIWVLAGVLVPTTDPATVILQGCIAAAKWATCSTVTAATTGTTLVGSNFKNTTTAANPTLTVVTSATALLYGGLHGGAASPASYVVTANYTSQFNNDYGALSARSSRRTSPVAAGSIVYDFTFATSDDYCIAAVALGEFTLPATGTGALVDGASAASGSGVSSSTGTGSPDAQSSAVAGSGVSKSTGTGALSSQASAVDGEGTAAAATVTGTGALLSAVSTVSGSGTSLSTGTGSLSAQAADTTGSGASLSAGTGSLAAQAVDATGAGLSLSTGQGDAEAAASSIAGAGIGTSTGLGDAEAGVSTIAGTGVSFSTGTGALAAQTAQTDGTGVSLSVGSGSLASQVSTVVGSEGAATITGTGALVAQAAGVSSSGVTFSTGIGTLLASAATVDGSDGSLGAITGSGVLICMAATVDGTDDLGLSGPFFVVVVDKVVVDARVIQKIYKAQGA